MEETNQSFVLYTSYAEILEGLSIEQMGYIFKAILEYKTTKKTTDLPVDLMVVFKFIKNQLDIDEKKYKDKTLKASINGRKGGAPKGNQNAKKQPKQPKTTENKHNDNDNVNVNDNDNVNVFNKEVVFEKKSDPYTSKTKDEFVAEYEKVFKVKPILLAPQLNKLAELKAEVPDFKENMRKAIEKLKKIEFSDINFTPSASWLLREDNFARVLNGEFDKKENVGLTRFDKERIAAQKRALKAIEETEKIKIANEKMREEACPPPFTAKELASKFINEGKEFKIG